MAHQIKAFVAKSGNLGLIPKGEKQLSHVFL